MEKELHVEYAAAALLSGNYRQKIERAQKFCAAAHWAFGIQIHNTTPADRLTTFRSAGVPLSFHLPVDCKYFINLANRDSSYAFDSLQKSVPVMRQYEADLGVFHGFLMTDRPIRGFNAGVSFKEAMSQAYREDLSLPGLPLCRNFTGESEFAERLERVKINLAEIKRRWPDLTLCIENDFPLYSSGLLLAESMLQLEAPLCLDVSHLWAACVLYSRSFLEQVEIMASTGNIECVHLHVSLVPSDCPAFDVTDGHRSLLYENDMNLPEMIRILRRWNVRHWVLETWEADVADLEVLADWLE